MTKPENFPYWQILCLGRSNLNDDMFRAIVSSENFRKHVKWADFSYNQLTEDCLDHLCLIKPKSLLYINLVGNLFEDPCETGGYDQGNLVLNSIYCSEAGIKLEKRYGPQPWLHSLSRFGTLCPSPEISWELNRRIIQESL